MTADLAHLAPTLITAFSASMVEFVEALTVILAVGLVRGWRGALTGAAVATLILAAMVGVFGPALGAAPLNGVRVVLGALMLLFGLRWLRKAALRAAGIIPLHDETAAFKSQIVRLRGQEAAGPRFDSVGFAAAFKITMIEGAEVVFIVIAIGAGRPDLLAPACLGAAAALAVVIALGVVLHRPLARVPENSLKFLVGVLLSSFGAFWFGEGLGIAWPGDDWAIPGLIAGFAATAFLAVRLGRPVDRRQAA
jgi:uncharacterized membrane protein